jgi:glycosyltransferase involved in cell wall biosynthesis
VREDQIIFSDNGMDVSPFQDFKRIPSPRIRFGFIGSIVEHKGVHTLVNAFNLVRGDKAELCIFGELEAFLEYSEQVQSSSRNKNTRFMGKFNNKRIAEVFSKIDVLVVPSIWYENSPLTIHEAFLSGTPVITAGHGGMADLVHNGVNGFLFEPGDEKSLAKVIQAIVDDPSLIEKTAKGIPHVKTIEEDAKDMEERYRLVMEGKKVTYP